jgi:hypothetical protein
MKIAVTAVAIALLGVAACSTHATETIVLKQAPAAAAAGHSVAAAATHAQPAPTVTKTVIKPVAEAPTSAAAAPVASPSSAPPQPVGVPNVTDPWAVVSAYYGDIESGDHAEAWALLDSGMTTGQTYQQFVDGFACTGAQTLSENWESGDNVNFDLAATNDCTGAVDDFTGTDTVENGKIVAANVTQTG